MKFLFILLVFIAGCVETQEIEIQTDSTPIPTPTATPKPPEFNIINYPDQIKIENTSTDYPTILDNPVIGMPIKYYINESSINFSYAVFYPEMINDTIEGINKWVEATDTISVEEVNNEKEAHVIINFIRTYGIREIISTEYGISWTNQLGEGGPQKFRNYLEYNIIDRSIMIIIPSAQNRCSTVNVAAHEFGHAIGLSHDTYVSSIMQDTSYDCSQRVVDASSRALEDIYKSAKPDLRFSEVSVKETETGFNINLDIRNVGILDSKNVSLQIFDGSFFKGKRYLDPIKPTETVKVLYENLQMQLKNNTMEIYIDIEEKQDEVSREDNKIIIVKK